MPITQIHGEAKKAALVFMFASIFLVSCAKVMALKTKQPRVNNNFTQSLLNEGAVYLFMAHVL